jgi:hypothetical protein
MKEGRETKDHRFLSLYLLSENISVSIVISFFQGFVPLGSCWFVLLLSDLNVSSFLTSSCLSCLALPGVAAFFVVWALCMADDLMRRQSQWYMTTSAGDVNSVVNPI